MSFEKRLVEAYLAKFRNRAEFARAIEVQYHQVMGWEKPGRVPERRNLEKIAEATGRSIDWLLYGDRESSSSGNVPAEVIDRVVADLNLDESTASALRSMHWTGAVPSEATLRSYAIDLSRNRAHSRKSA